MSCCYFCLKGVFFYKKRILWLDSGSIDLVYVVEYLGIFFGLFVDFSYEVIRVKKDEENEDMFDVEFDEFNEYLDEGCI